MILESVESYFENPVVCRHSIRVVPFQILGHAVPQVNCLEERVVSVEERSSRSSELVRKLGIVSKVFAKVMTCNTTKFQVEPSAVFLLLTESGVSGSMSFVRMFFNRGTLPTPPMHIGLLAQGFGGVVYRCTKVLKML